MNTRLRIAQIRVVPEKGNLKANHDTLMTVLGDVARTPVDVVVTPECFLDGYVATESSVAMRQMEEYAVDPSESGYVRAASKWAGDHATWLILGCSRRSSAGVFNTALILDRKGALRGCYDKVHCQAHDQKFLPGKSLPVFDSDFGLFGVLICADRRWPETVRSLALQGARIIFNPTYGMHDERNLHMMQTRSYESEVFIAFTHPRQSLITGPTGSILCDETTRGVGYSLSELDLSEVDRVRQSALAHLRDRQPHAYTA